MVFNVNLLLKILKLLYDHNNLSNMTLDPEQNRKFKCKFIQNQI